MMSGPKQRPTVGIWTDWPTEVGWRREGVTRLLGFIIEGAAARGTARFRICVSAENLASAREMLERLVAQEGVDWTLHVNRGVADGIAGAAGQSPMASKQAEAPPAGPPAAVMRWLLLPIGAALMALQLLRTLLRPLWRVLWRNGLSGMPGLARAILQGWRNPAIGASYLADRLDHCAISGGHSLAGWLRHWATEHSVESVPAAALTLDDAVAVPVSADGWLVLMPHFSSAAALAGPIATIFPDAAPLAFPLAWQPADWEPGGWLDRWQHQVMATLAVSSAVVVFSEHVVEAQLAPHFPIAREKIRTIRHAPPDLQPHLPFLPADRRRTPESRASAAALLRSHAAARGWTYLRDFPFEHVDYLAVSSVDQPTKNLTLTAEALRRLVRQDFLPTKLLTTARVDPDNPSPFMQIIRQERLGLDIQCMPDLPNDVHAAFYHAAALTIHPAFFEGGTFPFPFPESVSVGTPCLMARGPHTWELAAQVPQAADWLFDPYNPGELTRLIKDALRKRDNLLDRQLLACGVLCRRGWSDVAEAYVAAALGAESFRTQDCDRRRQVS
jgi:hypothetical protein